MNKLIQEIELHDKGYSAGLKEAIGAVQELAKENGIASSSVGNVTKEMRSAQKYAMTLAATYNQLSEEAKNTDWGKQMAKEMDAAIQKAGELADLRGDIQRQINNIASDTRPWDTMSEAVSVFAGGMQLAAGAVGAFTNDEQTAVQMLNLASGAQGVLNTITALGNAIQKESNIMKAVGAVKSKALAIASEIEAAAKGKGVIATKAATVAQKAFNVVAKANPYVLLATAAVAAAGAIWAFCKATQKSEFEEQKEQNALEETKKELQEVSEYYDKTGKSLEGLEDIQKNQPAMWQKLTAEARIYQKAVEATKAENDKLGKNTGDLVSKFMSLQTQWKGLRTEAQKKKFIEDNQSAFNSLGLSVNNLNDAYKVLVKNAPQVIAALKAIAEAKAYEEMYTDAIKRKETEWNKRDKSTAESRMKNGDSVAKYDSSTQEIGVTADQALKKNKEWQAAGIKANELEYVKAAGQVTGYYKLKKEAEDKIYKYRFAQARAINQKLQKSYDDDIAHYEKMLLEKQQAALDAQKNLATSGTKIDAGKVISGGSSSSGKNGGKNAKETAEEKYANTMAQIMLKEQKMMYDAEDSAINEQKSVEEKIKATETYINELSKDEKSIKKNKVKIDEATKILNKYKNRLKEVTRTVEDHTIIKNANQEYANTIDKLNTDRKNGWITEDEYNTQYINAIKTLTNKYKTVNDVNDELIKEINKKQKEIEYMSLQKEYNNADLAVDELIDEFRAALKNKPQGNEYYKEKKVANDKVNKQYQKYTTIDNSQDVWKMLSTEKDKYKQERAQWIKDNQVAATQLGIPNFDVDAIAKIEDVATASKEQITILDAAIEHLNKTLLGTNTSKIEAIMPDILRESELTEIIESAGEAQTEESKKAAEECDKVDQALMSWMHTNSKLVSQIVGDEKIFSTLMNIKDITEANEDETEAFNTALEKLYDAFYNGTEWATQWGEETRDVIKENIRLVEGYAKEIRNVEDAISLADNVGLSKQWKENDIARKGYIVNDRETYEQFVKLKYDPKQWDAVVKILEAKKIKLNLEAEDMFGAEFAEEIQKELESRKAEIGIDEESFNALNTLLKSIDNTLNEDVEALTNVFKKMPTEDVLDIEGKVRIKEDPAVIKKYLKKIQNIVNSTSVEMTIGLDEGDAALIEDEANDIQKKVQKVFDETKVKVDFEADPEAIEHFKEELINALKDLNLPEDVFKSLENKIGKSTAKALKKPKLQIKEYKGDASNYSIKGARSYEEVSKRNTQFKTGRGGITGLGMQQDVTDNMQKQLDEMLSAYKEAQDKLVEINKNEDVFSLNVDKAGLEKELDALGNEIDKMHDRIQERLKFQVQVEGFQNALAGFSSLASYGNTIATFADSWAQAGEAANGASEVFQKTMLVISLVEGAISAVNTVMTIANGIQNLFNIGKVAGAAASTEQAIAEGVLAGEETAAIAPTVAATAANKALEASYLDLAAAEIFAAHASIPFAGVGIAGGLVGAMMAAMTAQHAASLALAAMANGGIVGGDSFHGDSTLIRANKGEMILNNLEQKNLFDALKYGIGNPMGNSEVEFKLRGTDLIGLMNNTNAKKSRIR